MLFPVSSCKFRVSKHFNFTTILKNWSLLQGFENETKVSINKGAARGEFRYRTIATIELSNRWQL